MFSIETGEDHVEEVAKWWCSMGVQLWLSSPLSLLGSVSSMVTLSVCAFSVPTVLLY